MSMLKSKSASLILPSADPLACNFSVSLPSTPSKVTLCLQDIYECFQQLHPGLPASHLGVPFLSSIHYIQQCLQMQDIYECFTNPGRIQAYTQAPAKAEPRPGGQLSLFDGTVQGKFEELEPAKRLVLQWRFRWGSLLSLHMS